MAELYTREQAEAKLRELGFHWDGETFEWVKDDERGRLSWTPDDFHNPTKDVGRRFWLTHPITNLGRAKDLLLLGEEKR